MRENEFLEGGKSHEIMNSEIWIISDFHVWMTGNKERVLWLWQWRWKHDASGQTQWCRWFGERFFDGDAVRRRRPSAGGGKTSAFRVNGEELADEVCGETKRESWGTQCSPWSGWNAHSRPVAAATRKMDQIINRN